MRSTPNDRLLSQQPSRCGRLLTTKARKHEVTFCAGTPFREFGPQKRLETCGSCEPVSAATRASVGKPRAQGRVRRSSRSCACCTHSPGAAVSRGVEPVRGTDGLADTPPGAIDGSHQ